MLPLRFAGYGRTPGTPNAVVDGAPDGDTRLTLSHWPGSPTPPELRADLSAEIAFLALAEPDRFAGIEVVTNNHFDQDGLCAAFALIAPEQALARRDLIVEVARVGDFGVVRSRPAARIAMTIAAFDSDRSPFTDELRGLPYPDQCALLYERSLPLTVELLDRPERWRHLWADEDAHLQAGLDALGDGTVALVEHPDVDLAVVTVPDAWAERTAHRFTEARDAALHPMAVASTTDRLRVLTCHGRRYRFELRYESWVMLVSRRPAPRPDLRLLVPELDAAETGPARWQADPPGALTPQLRLADGAESSIAPDALVATLTRFLAGAAPAWDPFDVS